MLTNVARTTIYLFSKLKHSTYINHIVIRKFSMKFYVASVVS